SGMRLVAPQAPRQPEGGFGDSTGEAGDVRVVLRGVGGHYHGRSFTLERPRLVGRAPEADIRIDEAAFSERHARLEMLRGAVVRRPGDQAVFEARRRVVLAAPTGGRGDRRAEAAPAAAPAAGGRGGAMRLPWRLVTALVLAGLRALLLLFGTG